MTNSQYFKISLRKKSIMFTLKKLLKKVNSKKSVYI